MNSWRIHPRRERLLAAGSLRGAAVVRILALLLVLAGAVSPGFAAPRQSRPVGKRVAIDASRLRIMDGDTAEIRWRDAPAETVRFLGIDTAELYVATGSTRRRTPRGAEALGFARGAFTMAGRVELLRAATLDRYRRTLGYFFLDGRNFSVMAVEARLAVETVSRFGDNGLPGEAAAVQTAARATRRAQPRR